MQLRAEEISQIIKKQIQSYEKATLTTETGTILSVGDGIARIYGLEGAMAGELVEFPGERTGEVGREAAPQPRAHQRIVAELVAEPRRGLREKGVLPVDCVHVGLTPHV